MHESDRNGLLKRQRALLLALLDMSHAGAALQALERESGARSRPRSPFHTHALSLRARCYASARTNTGPAIRRRRNGTTS
jgi:hypothetical protein